MRRLSEIATRVAGALCLLAVVAAAPGASGQPQAAFVPRDDRIEDLPAGPGRDETFGLCIACHGFKLVSNQGMRRDKWDETLSWMSERHNMPAIEGADRDLILDYLSTHYPPKPASRDGGFKNPFSQ